MSPLVSNIGRVRFRLVSLFEGLYPLACYWCHYSGSVELREWYVALLFALVTTHGPNHHFANLWLDRCWLSKPTPSRLPQSSSVGVVPVCLVDRALFLVRASLVLAISRSTSSGLRSCCHMWDANYSSHHLIEIRSSMTFRRSIVFSISEIIQNLGTFPFSLYWDPAGATSFLLSSPKGPLVLSGSLVVA